MMSRTARQQMMFRGHRPIVQFSCRGCGRLIAARSIENCADAVRARRNRRFGRFIGVRQLRMFVEMVRGMLDWGLPFLSMHQLYQVIEHIAQKGDEETIDIDESAPLIRDMLNQLENLNIDEPMDDTDVESTDEPMDGPTSDSTPELTDDERIELQVL
ncbi:hypothetical protein FRC09_011638 [Ceratobasidium sp. 395]|nr:hypothetical protein FRC09_011638 [Ceratobasidium sp. 395]